MSKSEDCNRTSCAGESDVLLLDAVTFGYSKMFWALWNDHPDRRLPAKAQVRPDCIIASVVQHGMYSRRCSSTGRQQGNAAGAFWLDAIQVTAPSTDRCATWHDSSGQSMVLSKHHACCSPPPQEVCTAPPQNMFTAPPQEVFTARDGSTT